MNKFILKKLGEVLAFARIGITTLNQGKEGFLSVLPEDAIAKIEADLKDIETKIVSLFDEQTENSIEEASSKTEEKVTTMRDMYIDSEWSSKSEVLEWMGFYTGAALVHWRLVLGAAQELKDEELSSVAKDAIQFYIKIFLLDETFLFKIGAMSVK